MREKAVQQQQQQGWQTLFRSWQSKNYIRALRYTTIIAELNSQGIPQAMQSGFFCYSYCSFSVCPSLRSVYRTSALFAILFSFFILSICLHFWSYHVKHLSYSVVNNMIVLLFCSNDPQLSDVTNLVSSYLLVSFSLHPSSWRGLFFRHAENEFLQKIW